MGRCGDPKRLTFRFAALSLSAAAFACALTGPGRAQTPAAPPALAQLSPAQVEAFVDGVVAGSAQHGAVAGVSVAVVQNGQIILLKGYGLDRLAPARPVDPSRSLFRLGETSEIFTWILAHQAVERGKLKLDQPIDAALPDDLRPQSRGQSRAIHLADLMSHSAGFDEHLLGAGNAKLSPLDIHLRAYRALRVRDPGQVVSQSTYDADLAGVMAQRAFGAPDFQTLAEAQVFRPLGLRRTSFRDPYEPEPGLPAPLPAELAADLSQGFTAGPRGLTPEPDEVLLGAAPAKGAASTAADMARLMTVLLDGGAYEHGALYGPQTAAALRTPVFATPGGGAGRTLGLTRWPEPGGRTGYGLQGRTLWFASGLTLIPDLHLGVFVAVNTPTGATLTESLPRQIVAQFYGPTPARRAPTALADPGLFSGDYIGDRRAYSGLDGFAGRFLAAAHVSVSPEGLVTLSRGERNDHYVATDSPGVFAAADGGPQRLIFHLDSDGRAVSFDDPSGAQRFERPNLFMSPQAMLWVALAALSAALAAWIGAFTRKRILHPTPGQLLANQIGMVVAGLWLISALTLGADVAGADGQKLMAHWPDPLARFASATAVLASLGVIAMWWTLPRAFGQGSYRLDGWSAWRKARHVLAMGVWSAFALMLGFWGALIP